MGNCILVLVLYMLSLVRLYQQNLYVHRLIWPCRRWRLCGWSLCNAHHCSYATLSLTTIKNIIILNNTLFFTAGVCRVPWAVSVAVCPRTAFLSPLPLHIIQCMPDKGKGVGVELMGRTAAAVKRLEDKTPTITPVPWPTGRVALSSLLGGAWTGSSDSPV